LPPKRFEPVGVEFVVGSISAPGLCEGLEYNIGKDNPLRGVYLYQAAGESRVQPAINFSVMHGVRASLALERSGDVQQALEERNAEVSPHLSFVDGGGHGYAVVYLTTEELEVEFVCIPRPLERSESADGGPLAYRVAHRVKLWEPGTAPRLERTKSEGTLPLVV
jgi:alkaline phosphatase D